MIYEIRQNKNDPDMYEAYSVYTTTKGEVKPMFCFAIHRDCFSEAGVTSQLENGDSAYVEFILVPNNHTMAITINEAFK